MVHCWGISSGTAGMISQVRALAEELGVSYEIKNVPVPSPWSAMPNIAYATPLGAMMLRRFAPLDLFASPWPELVISCGRQASMVALGLKQVIGKGNTRFIHIHHPCVPMRYFDLVVTVDHDKLDGPNVIKTHYALHTITPESLAQAREKFAPQFARYPQPYVAVLLGGATRQYEFPPEAMAQMVMALQRLLNATQGSLLITPSRRTGEANISMLQGVFKDNPRVYVYDGNSDNPYMGLLALADTIIVTNDSVNMMSEAHATGKPIYILPLPGHSGTKQARFAERMVQEGVARPLGNKLEVWHYPISSEMQWLAEEVRNRLGQTGSP